jgi:hypothetical protein
MQAQAQPIESASVAVQLVSAQPAAETHCLAVAKQRADDAAANGLDRDTQKIVRDGTYAKCMAWQTAHPQ